MTLGTNGMGVHDPNQDENAVDMATKAKQELGKTKGAAHANGNEKAFAKQRHAQVASRPQFDNAKVGKACEDILDCVGNTPLVRLKNLEKEFNLKCELYAKCEYLNPGGSVKDRIALRMIEDAERDGVIRPGFTLIEPTSGNTGIGLALAAAVKGYKLIICMPEKMSKEKSDVLRALGAEIVRTPTEAAFDAPESHISVAKRLREEIPNSYILDQYKNPGNPEAHYETTANEIIQALDGKLDMLVAGAGTGGTITGTAKRLKEHDAGIEVVGVDPLGSILAEPASLNDPLFVDPYLVEGIGYDFIPQVLQRQYIDKWVKSTDSESFEMSRMLIRKEGLLVGGSSGSALSVVRKLAPTLREGQRCVVILPDNVRNYMTKFLSDEWMIEQGMLKNVADVEPGADEWWMNSVVGSMALPTPHTISPSMTCSEAIKVMKEEGFDQLPVVDDKGDVQGIVTESQLLFELRNQNLDAESPASKFAYKKFAEVSLSTKLWELSRILDRQPFVLVLASQKVLNDSSQVHVKKIILSILTRIDLLNHMLESTKTLSRSSSYQQL